MSARGRIFASVVRIDRSAFDGPFTLRSSLGVAIALLSAFATGNPLFGVAAAIGAMNTGFASRQGIYRTRLWIMVTMAFAMALSTLAGNVAAHSIPIEIAALFVWGIFYGLISSLGLAASVIGLNATIALIIFSSLQLPPSEALEAAAFVVYGGLVQIVLLVASWPVQRYPEERHTLAGAFRSLARYAEHIDCERPTIPPITTLTAVRAALADPRPFGRRITVAAFRTLLDEAERLRVTLGRIAATNCTPYLEHRNACVRALDAVADALDRARAPDDEALYAHLEADADNPLVAALFGQLRAAWRSASIPLSGLGMQGTKIPRIHWSEWGESIAILRANANLSSTFGRHALRLAVTLAFVGSIAHMLPVQRGYWMTLTAALVLRPDFTTTFVRGVARITGTLIGVILATVLVLVLPQTPHASLVLAICFAAAGYAVQQMNYAMFTVTITAYVVFLLALIGFPEHAAVVSRVIATVAGGTIAMLTYGIWPTWEAAQTRRRLAEFIAADREYVRALLSGLIARHTQSAAHVRALRDAVWSARVAADESLERMLGEPASNDDIPREAALGIMAASQRLGLANLTLFSIYSGTSQEMPQLAPFAAALETAFAAIDAQLRDQPAPNVNEGVRSAFASARASGDLRTALDMITDSANTIADILRNARAS